jgi:hypothetical protein
MQTVSISPVCTPQASLRMKFSKTGHWISRESIRIWGCERAAARSHPQIRGFTNGNS